MNDRELLELIATQVGTLTIDMQDVKDRLGGVEGEIKEVKERVIKMEDDHGKKLTVLSLESVEKESAAVFDDLFKNGTQSGMQDKNLRIIM